MKVGEGHLPLTQTQSTRKKTKMKILSLACMALVFCLFAGTDQASAADSISGTSYNFGITDYSRGEARVVKTSLPPAPPPLPFEWAPFLSLMMMAVVAGLVICLIVVVIL